ncbi:hypothetical protein A5714_07820 [Mycobacterium sp. E2462]|uniref:hypothetical protein n=1 Tax=Mycobacterium sp. E2462 TaxID=1834133 RepID=UPI0008017E6D|nr:hypothetical protein [Mycobacterium sp. E2462]OBI20617.1 hypothetical protein A5714_07820 [Mycobacterium sp. E2462]
MFRTKGEAAQWVTEQRQQWGTATWAPKSSQTFDEVADHWLKLQAAGVAADIVAAGTATPSA